MDTNSTRTRRSRRSLAAAVGALALAGGFALSATEEAAAAPSQCMIRTYFADAGHSDEVGMRTNCPGGGAWGRTSRFVEVETVELSTPGPGGARGGGGRPCEFNQTAGNKDPDRVVLECHNIPRPRR